MKLKIRRLEPGWITYVWLIYLVFFLVHPILDHVSWKEWLATLLGVGTFLFLYFSFFRTERPWNLAALGGMVLLGIVFAPHNGGAAGFFIYPACFVPFAVETEWAAIRLLAVILAVVGLETWIAHLPLGFLIPAGFLSACLGVGNIFFAQKNRSEHKLRRAHDEIEHLAKVAERERIARDLHDVLGHTLSVIILKSELAGKLVDRDPARAKSEIADVERTSREALSEVRNTIRGYRSQSLQAELKQAAAALETAGVSVNSETSEIKLTPAQESVVALIVREAVTNVVRHAHARNCQLRLSSLNSHCVLEIADDGRGGDQVEGNGLRGMRERIEALGGTLERETAAGTRLRIQFPLAPA